MAKITNSIEIDRPPAEVFAYLDEIERHGEWSETIVGVKRETPGPTGLGTRVTETRKLGGRTQDMTWEITEYDPPRRIAFRGITGPLRPVGTVTVEQAGAGSRVTSDLELEPHGLIGRLLAPLAAGQARKQVPKDQAKLKERLESS